MTFRTAHVASLAAGAAWLLLGGAPAMAHHLAHINGLVPTPLNGLISGLAHPVLGPDHLLFLLALALVAVRRPIQWVLPLLAVGLVGSVAALQWPLLAGAEVLASLSLVVEALVILGRLPSVLLVPAMAVHGAVLSGSVLGWSAMPLGAYLVGLLISQGLLLLLSQTLLRQLASHVDGRVRSILALLLLGCGAVWALAQTVA